MQKLFFAVSLLISQVVLSACVAPRGADTISPAGYAYNQAIAQTTSEQLLLNLVRLKYRDAIVFMDVDGVTTQHQYGASLSSETLFPFQQASNGSALLIPGVTTTERPTIVYKPLDSSQFAQDLLAPIAPETIVLLANSGWSIERLLACCLERFGDLSNAPSASGPTPETVPNNADFREASQLLRTLQKQERVRVDRLPDQNGTLGKTLLRIDASQMRECDRLKSLLGSDGCEMSYRLVAKGGQINDGEFYAQTRTVLGALYAISHAIETPPLHNQAQLTTPSAAEHSATKDWIDFTSGLFQVRSSEKQPKSASVQVYYRDHWFWIEDDDLDTKTTFNLMLFLLALQSAASDGASPLLTLSAGG